MPKLIKPELKKESLGKAVREKTQEQLAESKKKKLAKENEAPVTRVVELEAPKQLEYKSEKADPRKIRPVIQVRDLVKDYGDFRAVDNVSFDVKKGEIFGILGPNGAGKTTTLEIIETLTKKTSGRVAVDGLDIDIYPTQVKNIIGIQLQSGGFYPDLNLVETLQLFSDIYNVKINAKEILQSVNLQDKAKSYPEKLSGGQRQRFSIAVTLVADPTVIFLDEPTTGLDPQSRRNLWDTIKELKSRGKTVVMTTHYMDEAEILCDRIAIMDAGKILQINTVDGFINDLLGRGFTRSQATRDATMEDVFLDLTGKTLRE